jgi:hypothetical protein
MKTAQGRLDCAAIVIAASCVLSPISARKITPNVVRSIRQSILALPFARLLEAEAPEPDSTPHPERLNLE